MNRLWESPATHLFATEYGAKYPKAVTTLEQDADALLTFFDFPAEHWKHLRTSNVIESPFATVRLRQRVTKGAGSRTKGLLMAYKFLDMAQARWRRLDGAPSCRSCAMGSPSWTACSRRTSAASPEREPRSAPLASPDSPVHIHPNNSGPGRGVGGSSQVGAIRFRRSEIHALTRGRNRAETDPVAESRMLSARGTAAIAPKRPKAGSSTAGIEKKPSDRRVTVLAAVRLRLAGVGSALRSRDPATHRPPRTARTKFGPSQQYFRPYSSVAPS
jgi:hypothetical protein